MKMTPEVRALYDTIVEIKLPKAYRNDEHAVVGDIVPEEIIRKIAKKLMEDINND